MEVSNAQLHQTMASQFEDAMKFPKTQQQQQQEEAQQQEKRVRPNPEQALHCPRCDSSNTKFCYYNNYSLTQPRYFCKGCRRYWTQGGSLRNVPVGGGCRRNKRTSGPSNSSSSSSSKISQFDQDFTNNPNPFLPLPPLPYDPNELSFTFATLQNPNLNPSQGLADLENNINSGLYYYGFGNAGEGVVTMNSTEAVTAAAAAAGTTASQGCGDGEEDSKLLMMGSVLHQWPVHAGGDEEHHDNLMMATDPVLRDYWKNYGAGSTSLHGLINSSLY